MASVDGRSQHSPRTSRPPPPGVAEGGIWGKSSVVGEKTVVASLCISNFFLICPIDEQDAYLHKGWVYDAAGRKLGIVETTKFVPNSKQEGPKKQGSRKHVRKQGSRCK